MTFELWDTDSGNLIAVHPSRGAALVFVKTVVAEDGEHAVERWELFEMRDGERADSVAYGEQLAALAGAHHPTAV